MELSSPLPRIENFRIIENFCPQIDRVVEMLKLGGFRTMRPPVENKETGHDEYDGMAFLAPQSYLFSALCQAINTPALPNRNFFRRTDDKTETAFVHSDRGDGAKTCIAYLNDYADGSGTAFYRHRASGLTRMPAIKDMKANGTFDAMWADMQNPSSEVWEELDFVRGIKNRALIFDAPLFHSRRQGILPASEEGGSIANPEGRIVWVTHFHTPATVDYQD